MEADRGPQGQPHVGFMELHDIAQTQAKGDSEGREEDRSSS